MSGHWRGCCCSSTVDCPGTCDFASSYMITGLAGGVDWERSWKFPLCGQCGDYDTCDLKSQWSFTASFYQLSPATLTRVTSNIDGVHCCYQATGTMVINYTLSRAERIKTCVPPTTDICEISDTWSGTTETTFCYQVSCDMAAWNGGQGWVHTLTMCSYEVRDIDVMVKDCGSVIGAEDCPTARVKIVAGGLTTSWVSKFGALTALDPDIAWQGWCNYKTADCNYVKPGNDFPGGDGVGCMPKMQEQSKLYGPMALYYYPQDEIFTECDYTTAPPVWTGAVPCANQFGASNALDYCGGDFEWDLDCCSSRWNAGATRATFS
jgi:hypothetical protein